MNQIIQLGRKSWTAYVWPIVSKLFTLVLVCAIAAVIDRRLAVACGALISLSAAYSLAVIRSWHLYATHEGVFVAGGVLPWAKSHYGVRWHDMDCAIYQNSFGSWLLKSYDVRVTHRFTKSSEVVFGRLHMGHRAVGVITTLQSQARLGRMSSGRALAEID